MLVRSLYRDTGHYRDMPGHLSRRGLLATGTEHRDTERGLPRRGSPSNVPLSRAPESVPVGC